MEDILIGSKEVIQNGIIKPLILFGCLILWVGVAALFAGDDPRYPEDTNEFND